MIDCFEFIHCMENCGIDFVTGVPDSLLKDICACMASVLGPKRHIIATNEGSAVGLAIGHYLATSRPALVYMQNSGLGNAINPITSLADKRVYAVPMVLMIGWRGEMLINNTQLHDEPQHIKQGQITLEQLDILEIPYRVVDASKHLIGEYLQQSVLDCLAIQGPTALVIRKNTFAPFKNVFPLQIGVEIRREEAIRQVLSMVPASAAIVSTTGMISRELYELREETGNQHNRDFLTVGGMGHASQIAAGIAFAQPNRRVVCIDGDGSLLMHTGSLAVSADCSNLVHIVLNNEAHDSVGGQPTKGNTLRFDHIAYALGYKHVDIAISSDEIREKLARMFTLKDSAFLEIRCKRGARMDLGRPRCSPVNNKKEFMKFLGMDQ
ncbi:phosphonopyruvate decarboxylase [Vulcanococcus sp.]|jgi:phosphonopyruvate decarboxylase|uniref:phosphonopyruvate decarboxylase n=1 Tax=Vulcanococcus sp. TaxID=2856995 RepID=UPI00342B6EFA